MFRAKTRWPARTLFGAVLRSLALPGNARLVCALAAVASGPAVAVGLGAITQQSALGQPLRIVIPVISAVGEELPPECFKLAPSERDADGIPQLMFGRVGLERAPSGTRLVVTHARPVNEPVVRLTIQAGCDNAVRRVYTLLMDPLPIEPPLVAADAGAPGGVAVPQPSAAAAEPARVAAEPARDAAGAAPASSAAPRAPAAAATTAQTGTRAQRRPVQAKPRATARTAAPPRAPRAAAAQPRLRVSSARPSAAPSGAAKAASDAQQERAQQELADALEAETVVLRQRIVELTALVERMQQEVNANEIAQRAVAEAATAAATAPPSPPPSPFRQWWDDNGTMLGAIVGLPLLLAGGLLWKRRQDSARMDTWRPARRETTGTTVPPDPQPAPLRNRPAGVPKPGAETVTRPPMAVPKKARVREGASALAVSELSQVTEEARVYVALGRPDRAIEVLNEHIRKMPRSMPAAWLMLLNLYHAAGRQQEFRRLAEEFHVHFNVQTPLWEGVADGESADTGLDTYPHIVKQIVSLWSRPTECRERLEQLLYGNREGRRIGFPLAAYGDILLLLQMIDTPPVVDIDSDLARHAKLGAARPDAPVPRSPAKRTSLPAAEPARKPMPPDPTRAAPPAQPPLRFEFDPDANAGKPGKKPSS